ncbi:unnamed protein product [Closterium sp. Yama58-4]|nr:unnamed protein product [Closterium sp. Yama58-4]
MLRRRQQGRAASGVYASAAVHIVPYNRHPSPPRVAVPAARVPAAAGPSNEEAGTYAGPDPFEHNEGDVEEWPEDGVNPGEQHDDEEEEDDWWNAGLRADPDDVYEWHRDDDEAPDPDTGEGQSRAEQDATDVAAEAAAEDDEYDTDNEMPDLIVPKFPERGRPKEEEKCQKAPVRPPRRIHKGERKRHAISVKWLDHLLELKSVRVTAREAEVQPSTQVLRRCAKSQVTPRCGKGGPPRRHGARRVSAHIASPLSRARHDCGNDAEVE